MRQSGFSKQLLVQESWARVGGLSWTYYDIAQAAYAGFLAEEAAKLPMPAQDEDPTDFMEQERRMMVAGIKTIVFSAMSVEAAAFDFSAIHFGDRYAEQYLDKLDLVSKWVVAPKLLTSASLHERGPALNALRSLVRARNQLVHSKSLPFDPALFDKPGDSASDAFPGDVHNAYKAVALLSMEMKDLLGVYCPGLPQFGKEIRRAVELPLLVQKVVDRCREIHQRSQSQLST